MEPLLLITCHKYFSVKLQLASSFFSGLLLWLFYDALGGRHWNGWRQVSSHSIWLLTYCLDRTVELRTGLHFPSVLSSASTAIRPPPWPFDSSRNAACWLAAAQNPGVLIAAEATTANTRNNFLVNINIYVGPFVRPSLQRRLTSWGIPPLEVRFTVNSVEWLHEGGCDNL